jgi:hypothetical protein
MREEWAQTAEIGVSGEDLHITVRTTSATLGVGDMMLEASHR